ncbi:MULTISPECIES: DUF3422 family protein [Actibacterium]|uniref:Putative membrane-anchored protein n=1 Tax=Actibacterium naphthalenivorans TaxID=1614693 RepID=A0A840C6E9_9RHOB|nr:MULTISPECIES: DUF3422 domain-containing protein [Actibacterium]ALG89866.1 hypothetical protein TQ29_06230 [Actibacterium sp. EMB200-NS6]MBB4020413.1 putative membrane-anchored protein [Actibacterium naphthalenivorans]
MSPIEDHPLRYMMANELHARPFPALETPCHAAYLAIKRPHDAANRDRGADRAHLLDLLDRFGAQHPQPDATHFFGDIGRHKLKWESHTEFVTYTIFTDGVADRPFDPSAFEVFPDDWLATAPGLRITSALIRMEQLREPDESIVRRLGDWFVPESLACSGVLDDSAVMASDFRIDSAGHMRFALFVRPETGARRVGRIVQRLTEIETYKAMSMLGLPRARELSAQMGAIDPKLVTLVGDLKTGDHTPEETLHALLAISAELENMTAQSQFRFGATAAYEAIVHQRIEVMRESRFEGRQTFREFMMRRFDPAMRTVKSTERRLHEMTERAIRAGELLRTQVDVDRSAQNQKLLESMDRRADLQLRLQKTVEGLSVVAISYYAVSLASYMAYPLAEPLGLSKGMLTAMLTPLVVLGVWLMIRRIRHEME